MGAMAAAVAAMHWFVWIGEAAEQPVQVWTAVSIGGLVAAFVAIRSGWSRRLRDPSLTIPQMVYAIACAAWAYALVGAGRGAVFLIVMVILMFGMFIATPRQMARVSAFAVVLFAAVMGGMAWWRPASYPPAVEMGHFLMVATMVPAVSLLAARIARLRARSRQQRAELAAALARIRELATRDEITGLVNRRHLMELMAQEHQRCIRSGHTFCIAVIEAEGAADADALRAVAAEGQRWVRGADVLAHWDGGRFVLLMSDTRAQLARGGLERLRDRVRAAQPGVRLVCGLAEHHAGEAVGDALARAEALLVEARRAARATAA